MSTTFPRKPAAVSGCELSQPVALPSEGNSPSTGNSTPAAVACCITEPIMPTEAAAMEMAPARRKLRRSWLTAKARTLSVVFMTVFPMLRLVPNNRLCGQSGDYSVRQIYQQQVESEPRPPLKAEIPCAAHRQEDRKQRQHGREEVEKTEEVQPLPDDLYKKSERNPPQPGPEERPVYVRRFQGDWRVYPECRAQPQRKQQMAEKDHGQSAHNPRREADCHPLSQRQSTFHHVRVFLRHVQRPLRKP